MADIIDSNSASFELEPQHQPADFLDQQVNATPEAVLDPERGGKFSRAYQVAKRAVQLSVIAAELSPANEVVRYGALAYALGHSNGGPLIGAAALGGATLAVEGPAAMATADIITTDKSVKAINWINSRLHKVLPEDARMSPVMEAGVAMVGGSAVVLAEKQREDPTRTTQENRKHGRFTASWMAGYFALEGAFIGANSDHGSVLNSKTIGAAAIATAVTWAGTKWATSRGKRTENKKNESEEVTNG